ncbi:TPA: hypothetical protein H1016_03250 [archaeon]|uniref:Uncharacterized protein n=1 Tax=Candidatus Naiadarchaeum limnaeum TaxID=2756139 RepID=A0A832X655_9ARCH|nr:hypothetical protein [Candidatus Naiadarchaeum limnaeum]
MEQKDTLRDNIEDMGYFVGWMIFGVLIGWGIAWLAQHPWMSSPFYDFYGVAGAAIAVMWASFRRQKHLEHLPHVRMHLERMAGKKR